MSHAGSGDSRLSKNQRREAAREKAKELREAHRKKERRNRFVLQGGIIVAALAIVTIVTLVIVQSVRPDGPGPRNMLSDGVVIGSGFTAQTTAALDAGDEPVDTPAVDGVIAIQIWVDYMCPLCGQFEQANSDQIETLVESGAATLEIHPVAILDRVSAGTRYSTRAANAAGCVANYSPDSFYEFNSLMFENQPEEDSEGLTDDELVAITEEAGVSRATDIATCITEPARGFRKWVATATDRAAADPDLAGDDGGFGTPTVLVDGNRFPGDPGDPIAFAQFVAEADGAAFSEESTESPSPSPTPVAP